jgi:hypothetical protein
MTVKKHRGRTSVSLSFSCPPEMEAAINRRSMELGLENRSLYLRKLFERDLVSAGLYDPRKFQGDAPPRIKRGKPARPKTRGSTGPNKAGSSGARKP